MFRKIRQVKTDVTCGRADVQNLIRVFYVCTNANNNEILSHIKPLKQRDTISFSTKISEFPPPPQKMLVSYLRLSEKKHYFE